MHLGKLCSARSKEREALTEREAIEALRDTGLRRARDSKARRRNLTGEIWAGHNDQPDSKETQKHDPEHKH